MHLIAGNAQALQSESIRRFSEAQDAQLADALAGYTLLAPEALQSFYRGNRHQPVWTGSPAASERLAELLEAIKASALHGFDPGRYHRATLANPEAPELVRELLATDAYLAQAKHRISGVVDPQTIDPDWHLLKDDADTAMLLQRSVTGSSVGRDLEQLWPQSTEYRALLARRAQLVTTESTESTTVPAGPALKHGQSEPRVVALKQRLLGPGEYSQIYDDDLFTAVRAFQYGAGLEDDGVVGPATLEVLNSTRVAWIDRIDANLERLRWLPAEVPEAHLRVNIAAFQLRAIAGGEDQFSMRIIVGRPHRRTPVFTETMKYMVYNPYWNVPYSIATKDKLPLMKQNAAALEAQGYEVRSADSGDYVGVASVDWSAVTARQFTYALRQKPGPNNALGKIKFMLPNPFSVYLHDTPDNGLFRKQERSFSSGCIRLSEPIGLARWILERDGQVAAAKALEQRLARGETETVYLNQPLPVLILYLTAFTDDEGQVVFRRDIYQRDPAIVAALRGES